MPDDELRLGGHRPDWERRDPFVPLLLGFVSSKRRLCDLIEGHASQVGRLGDEVENRIIFALLGALALGAHVERHLDAIAPKKRRSSTPRRIRPQLGDLRA